MDDEEIIKARISEALKLDLPEKLINLHHYNHIGAWPIWLKKFPDSVPSLVTSAKEKGEVYDKVILVKIEDQEFEFSKIKTGEDPTNDRYTYSYWNYEIFFQSKYVFGIKVREHWAGGKPEFMEVDGYVPGEWQNVFFRLKEVCEQLAKEKARITTLEKRKQKLEKEELRKRKFGLD